MGTGTGWSPKGLLAPNTNRLASAFSSALIQAPSAHVCNEKISTATRDDIGERFANQQSPKQRHGSNNTRLNDEKALQTPPNVPRVDYAADSQSDMQRAVQARV